MGGLIEVEGVEVAHGHGVKNLHNPHFPTARVPGSSDDGIGPLRKRRRSGSAIDKAAELSQLSLADDGATFFSLVNVTMQSK